MDPRTRTPYTALNSEQRIPCPTPAPATLGPATLRAAATQRTPRPSPPGWKHALAAPQPHLRFLSDALHAVRRSTCATHPAATPDAPLSTHLLAPPEASSQLYTASRAPNWPHLNKILATPTPLSHTSRPHLAAHLSTAPDVLFNRTFTHTSQPHLGFLCNTLQAVRSVAAHVLPGLLKQVMQQAHSIAAAGLSSDDLVTRACATHPVCGTQCHQDACRVQAQGAASLRLAVHVQPRGSLITQDMGARAAPDGRLWHACAFVLLP